MKIALIGTYPEQPGDVMGGVANVIQYLAQGFADKGHEVHVISPGTDNRESDAWHPVHVCYVKAPAMIPPTLTNPVWVRKHIHRILDKLQPDICHFHGTATFSLGCHLPHVLTLHGVSEFDVRYSGNFAGKIKSVLQAAIEGYCRRRNRNFIIINPYILDVLGSQIRGRTWTIENPVACEFFSRQTPAAGKALLYAGMINRRKNVLGMLQVFARVVQRDPEFRLVLAGPVRDATYHSECLEFIARNGLGSSVCYVGSLDSAGIADALVRSSCLLLLSWQETAPLIIGEALAAGVPVVASRAGGVAHMIDPGVNGFVVDADDQVGTLEAVFEVHACEEVWRTMSTAARATARERFHPDTILEKTLAVYRQLIEEGGRT